MKQTAQFIKKHGSVEHLLAAFAALETVQDKNFAMTDDFGEPFKITDKGRCNTVCNAAGWVAQFPHFKRLGVKMEEMTVKGETRYVPVLKTADGELAVGYNALAYALDMDLHTALKMLSPHYYPQNGEGVKVGDVLKRLKSVLNKAGGGEPLKAHLKAQKAALKAQNKPKKGPKKGQKQAKKA